MSARNEPEAVLARVLLEDVAGLPEPTEEELVQRVLKALETRGYRLAPILPRRRVFVPAVTPDNLYPWIWRDSGAIACSSSPNEPPPGDRWELMYVERIVDEEAPE